jgi:arylsulfatase
MRYSIIRCLIGALSLAAVLSTAGCGRIPEDPSQPDPDAMASQLREEAANSNVVICVLDAARPDHLGCYGYPRATTPVIDRLAGESVVFESHYCQATYTGASTASLFTGQYPATHLVSRTHHLPDSAFTLARGLEQAGLRTVLLSSNALVWPEGRYGIGDDFQDIYARLEIDAVLQEGEKRHHSPEPLLRLFESWLAEHGDERFLAYLHFIPPHFPYDMPESYRLRFAGLRPPGYQTANYHPGVYDFPVEGQNMEAPQLPMWINLYDSNLRYGDWALGEVERLLREAGVFDDTVFIVTADHGEAFGEHGWVFHGVPWHEEVTRIPLIVRFPQGVAAGTRVTALTASVDLLPTIMDLFGLGWPEGTVQGRSLLPLVTGGSDTVHHYVFTRASGADGGKYVVRGERYSLLLWGNGEWRALYDMELDPQQRENIIEREPEVADELVDAFRAFAESQRLPLLRYLRVAGEKRKLANAEEQEDDGDLSSVASPEIRKDLKALGYLK